MTRFTNRVKDNNGKPRRIEHPILFAYHSLYEVLFNNGQTEYLIEHFIAENMLSQVDSELHHYQVIKEISNQSAYGSALMRSNGFRKNHGVNIHAKKTTRGWKL